MVVYVPTVEFSWIFTTDWGDTLGFLSYVGQVQQQREGLCLWQQGRVCASGQLQLPQQKVCKCVCMKRGQYCVSTVCILFLCIIYIHTEVVTVYTYILDKGCFWLSAVFIQQLNLQTFKCHKCICFVQKLAETTRKYIKLAHLLAIVWGLASGYPLNSQ